MDLNEFQTPITDELIASLTKEEQDSFYDYINNVEFIKRCISSNRKRAKDLERTADGRIVVDICNPHILENMEYFRPAANHYKKHGTYTNLRPNGNPNSEFGVFLRTELDRCWEGYTRESDGEWIPGELYFYWNYSQILLSQTIEGTAQADRVEDFPEIWEATYLWAHYMEQAKKGGVYNDYKGGEDAVVIARRGVGKSYFMAAVLARIFTVGSTKKVRKKVKGLVVAYEKEYLTKDGILNKFVSMIDFLANNTQFPSARIKNSIGEMSWKMGYVDAVGGTEKGTLNEILGLSARDNPDKVRGKRSHEVIYEEFGSFPKFLETWVTSEYNVREGDFSFGRRMAIGTGGTEGCLTANNIVILSSGEFKKVSELTLNDSIIGFDLDKKCTSIEAITYFQPKQNIPCYRLNTNQYRELEASYNHPVYASNTIDSNKRRIFKWIPISELKVGDLVTIPQTIPYFGIKEIWEPRLVGLLIGDGSYGLNQNVRINSCDEEILNFCMKKCDYTEQIVYITKDAKVFKTLHLKKLRPILRELGIYGQTKTNKRLPNGFSTFSKNTLAQLIAGLFDTDGNISNTYNKKRNKYSSIISLSSVSLELLKEVRDVLLKFGIHCVIHYKIDKYPSKYNNIKGNNGYFSLEISDRDSIINFTKEIELLIGYKKRALQEAHKIAITKKSLRSHKDFYTEKIKDITYIGNQTIYNLSTKNTHTYLSNNIITHNSDFSGALELLYNPKGYHVYGLPNVFDKNARGKNTTILFLGAYLNRKGFYNKDGVSDIIGALVSELKARTLIKYNSSDPMAITRRKAEMPITLQEAIMRRDSTLYPVADLTDTINEIDLYTRHWDELWIGKLTLTNGEVVWSPDLEVSVIKDFPHKDNKLEGAICIRQMPQTDSTGRVPWGRYIAGIDPYDDDASSTMSLGSLYILDLWTDELVLEYTGRPTFAEDFYENCRRALIMYNAECNYENNKKGLFTYFSKHNSLYLLSDTLEFLKDKEMMKGGLYGNKAKGTNASDAIKAYARRCIRDWLLKPKVKYIEDLSNNEPEPIEVTVKNLTHIPFKALLRELSQWNPDGNFDRHDALAMLMLIREDKLRLLGDMTASEAAAERDLDYLGDDEFFKNNYRTGKEDSYHNRMSNQVLQS